MDINNFDYYISTKVQFLDTEIISFLSLIYQNVYFIFTLFVLFNVLVYFFDKTRFKQIFIHLFSAVFIHFIFTELVIKEIFFRERPYLQYAGILIQRGHQYIDSSFPSSHVIVISILSFCIIKYYRKFSSLAIFMILLMMFSRIYDGIHFFTDTVASVFFAYLYFYISRIFFYKFAK